MCWRNGDTIGTGGRTYQQHVDYYNTERWLPIQYYKGSWGSKDGFILTNGVNRCVPGSYNNLTCDMRNVTWVETFWSPRYINYEYWTTDGLYGIQCDEFGEPIPLAHSTANITFKKWNGKHLFDKTNPIFRQL